MLEFNLKKKQARAIQNLGYKIILWDVLSFDWKAKTKPQTCLKTIISKAKKGSIIVCHDSEKAFKNLKYTLPRALDYFSKKGFVFKGL